MRLVFLQHGSAGCSLLGKPLVRDPYYSQALENFTLPLLERGARWISDTLAVLAGCYTILVAATASGERKKDKV